MINIYKEIDLLVKDLKVKNYERYSELIKEAKLSGSVATEILGLVLEELKRHDQEIKKEDVSLIRKAKKIETEIEKVLKLEYK